MSILPIERQNARWWHVLNATMRLAILRGATRPFAKNVIVNEYPKSGGSWLSQMLSEAVKLPFPRNRLPMLSSCLMQCHILNPFGMRKVVIIWRDGRDVAVSFYHHLIIGNEYSGNHNSIKTAKRLGITEPQNICENLPIFIESMMKGKVGPSFTWPQFVESWHGRAGVIETRYEDLLLNPRVELHRIASELTGHEPDIKFISEIVNRYSFQSQSGRKQGEEKNNSFMRKGVSGDWINYFSHDAKELFDFHAGHALNALGYSDR